MVEAGVDEMLLVVENFVSESERLDLLCAAYSASPDDWSKKDDGGAYWVGNRYPFESPIFNSLNKRIKLYFSDYKSISPFRAIQRITTGNGMGEHTDGYPIRLFGCVVYLNDGFSGGDLVYPRQNLRFTPTPGVLVVHAGDEPHLVETVTGGIRYMLTCFINRNGVS